MSASLPNQSFLRQPAFIEEKRDAAKLIFNIKTHNAGYTAELCDATRLQAALIQVRKQFLTNTGSNQEDINASFLNLNTQSASLADTKEEIGAANLNGAGSELNEALATPPSETSLFNLFSKMPDASSGNEGASSLPPLGGPKS
jgi:hypothetical protein